MSEIKKTEDELKQEIQDEYNLEDGDERINKILTVKKDRYTATQAKKKAQKEAEDFKKGKDFYKSKADPKGTQAKKATSGEQPEHSLKDIRALNNVEDDDLDKVLDYANKFHDGKAHKALADTDLQAILKNRAEERKTANATNTGKGKRGSSKVDGAAILRKVRENKDFPDSDEAIDAMLDAKQSEA